MDYYYDDENEIASKNYFYNNKKLILVFTIVVVVFMMFIIWKIVKGNPYNKIEKNMVSKAREYVEKYGISSLGEVYLDTIKLGYDLPDTCNILSGVIYNNGEYEPYLKCREYESKLYNNNQNGFNLIGDDVIILLKGMEYYELGTNISDAIVSGSVGSDDGIYTIKYYTKNFSKTLYRKVIVLNYPNIIDNYPKFLNVTNVIAVIPKGRMYNDSVAAFDKNEGDITTKIVKNSNLNINISGDYKIIYYVRNSLGYARMHEQQIKVVNPEYFNPPILSYTLSSTELTNEEVVINIKIDGERYKYTILPDDTIKTGKEFTYTVYNSGIYSFTTVDDNNYGNSTIIKINNINKNKPVGTCTATIYNGKTEFDVTVTSTNGIAGYKYITENNETEFIASSKYSAPIAESASVIVKDSFGNENTFKCKVVKKSSLDDSGIHRVFKGVSLNMPISLALQRYGHSISDVNTCIRNRVIAAGPGTRYGVAAAAYALIDCMSSLSGYVVSYDHLGGKVGGSNCLSTVNADLCGKLGINSNWGTSSSNCGLDVCYKGLNCATAVRWAMCNGGMDLCSKGSAAAYNMGSKLYFPEAEIIDINGSTSSNGQRSAVAIRRLKPGDVVVDDEGGGHIFIVVGRDENGIYTAEDGSYMRNISYSTLTNGKIKYRLLLLDNYYANPKNQNNLYK